MHFSEDYADREEFHKALLAELQENEVDLIVLAGFLVAIPPMIVEAYPKPDHQYPSVTDPVFLWNRILWTEGP